MEAEKRSGFGIESIEIERFRNFLPATLPLGRYVTVISGQNGTGKSTLLGMLGQPFGLDDASDVFGRAMRAKFTDMFKLSPEHDIPGEHVYFVNRADDQLYPRGTHVQVKSYARTGYEKLPIRIVTGAKRERGDGSIDYPVIYLGLRRTYPVGEIPNATSSPAPLSEEEAELLDGWYKQVFMTWRQGDIEPVKLSARTAKKETILVNAQDYDYLANSAGQDNLGQILASLLSFRRLKAERGDSFRGGLLLIDELDVTLFPASQEALFDLLMDVATEIGIQVVFTTHSFPLVEHAMSRRKRGGRDGRRDVEVIYLRRRDSGISRVEDPTMGDILADLSVRPPKRKKTPKVEVWCEDEEAKWLLRKLLPAKAYSKCRVISAKLSCGELAELATRDEIPSLENVLFVVDGDAVKSASKKIKGCSRLCVLPTGDTNPERAIYDALCSLEDDGDFWTSMEERHGYTRQMFERSFEEAHAPVAGHDKSGRKADKSWFNSEKAKGVWGDNGVDAFRQWRSMNEEACQQFVEVISERIDKVIRRVEGMAKRDSAG